MRRKIQNKKKTNIRKTEIEMTNFDYYAPTKVVFGKGTEDQEDMYRIYKMAMWRCFLMNPAGRQNQQERVVKNK